MNNEESRIQRACVEYFRYKYPKYLIFSVPNGGLRNKITARILKAEGALAGVSDLIVVLPGKVVFIEIKTQKGKQSQKQKDFEYKIGTLCGYYFVCHSLDEFIELLNTLVYETHKNGTQTTERVKGKPGRTV
ncbi:VRR-NUC domain-containing protein [Parabacteroides sp. APC149_11_2_Y6]